jgi:hypothetical protein
VASGPQVHVGEANVPGVGRAAVSEGEDSLPTPDSGFFFLFLVVIGFELRASCLLGRRLPREPLCHLPQGILDEGRWPFCSGFRFVLFFYFFDSGSCYVAQAGLELGILLSVSRIPG